MPSSKKTVIQISAKVAYKRRSYTRHIHIHELKTASTNTNKDDTTAVYTTYSAMKSNEMFNAIAKSGIQRLTHQDRLTVHVR